MVRSFPTKTRRVGRFFGSQSRRSKAPRKARIAGQSSTVGCRLRRYVSISQTRQTLLARWPFRIPQQRRSRANAVNDNALPLPLRQNLNRLPEDRSRGRGRLPARESNILEGHFSNKILFVPGEPHLMEGSNRMRELP